MSSDDPKRAFAVDVVRRLTEAGFQALWAGGCVRDSLMGRPAKDYDVATDARPEEVRKLFGHKRTLAIGASFGVVVVLGKKDEGQIEVATFRTEGPYADGRRPDHVSFSTPEEDAKRRDFTINGMFYDPLEDQVLDYVGGLADLRGSLIRAIGDPHDRIREDKLRMLRAVRFAATMDFGLDVKTADAVREMAAEIHVVSAERISQELRRMLADRHREKAIRLAHSLGLLAEILPELEPVFGHDVDRIPESGQRVLDRLKSVESPHFELALAILLHAVASNNSGRRQRPSDVVVEVGKRLRLSNHEIDRTGWLVDHYHALDSAETLSLAALKRIVIEEFFDDLLNILRARLQADGGELTSLEFCEEFLSATPMDEINPPVLVSGDDLIAIGFRPGKTFKPILDAIRDAQLNGTISTRDEGLDLARRLRKASEAEE